MARLGVLSRFAWVLLLTSLFVSRADNHCSADATRAVARHLARGSVKLTPAEPLFFVHLPKTAGSTLQRLLHLGLRDTLDAPDRLLIMESSCKPLSWARHEPCSRVADVGCLSCAQHIEQAACATAFLGHFRPVKLFSTLRDVDDRLTNATGAVCRRAWSDRWPVTDGGAPSAAAAELYAQRHAALLRRSLCIVVFREPVDRAISHFYEFIAASGTGKGTSELSAPEFFARHGAEFFAHATGGNLQTDWLGGARRAAREGGGRPLRRRRAGALRRHARDARALPARAVVVGRAPARAYQSASWHDRRGARADARGARAAAQGGHAAVRARALRRDATGGVRAARGA